MDNQPTTPATEQPQQDQTQAAPMPAPAAEQPAEQTFAPASSPAAAEQPAAQPSFATPAPAVPQPAAGQPVQHAPEDPGKTMGLLGLIFAFIAPLIGLVLSIIGMKKSKSVGKSNGLAVAGLVISIIGLLFGTLFWGGVILGAVNTAQKCADLGPGYHVEGGTTYTCN